MIQIEYLDFNEAFAGLQDKQVRCIQTVNDLYKKDTVWTIAAIAVNHGIPVFYFHGGGCVACKYFEIL